MTQTTNLQKLTFVGTDVNKETSLLEYGLLVSLEKHLDGSGTHFCIYRVDQNHFDCGHISEDQINGYILGKEFPSPDDIKGFLSFIGDDAAHWLKFTFATKLADLLQYWGYENIFGTSYYPMTESEAIERYLPVS